MFKIVLLGDNAVGKTSIRKRYLGEGFANAYAVTLGVDISVKRFFYEETPYTFQIWDLGGHASFHVVRKLYYKNIKALIVVFDLSNIETLLNVKNWIEEYMQFGDNEHICSILLGNKEDLVHSLHDSMKQTISKMVQFMKEELGHEILYIPTSALSGKNVNEAFEWIIQTNISYSN